MSLSHEMENIFPELSANDMEICIERAWNLGSKEVNGKDVAAYVNWNVAWPPEGSPGAGSGKGDTPTASDRGMNPEFNFRKRIDIVRTKPFQRYLERKKATFEVFHYKGFLRKSISLGKAIIKLDTLLKKAEIHEVLELVDHVRRPTGGKLEIRIRLRTPFLQPEIITKTEKRHTTDEFNQDFTGLKPSSTSTSSKKSSLSPSSSPSSSLSKKSSKQNVKLPSSSSSSSSTVTATATSSSTATASAVSAATASASAASAALSSLSSSSAATTTTATTATTNNVTPTDLISSVSPQPSNTEKDELEQQLNSVENIVSNLVLQNEIELITNQITTLEAQKKPIPEDLLDRKNELEIKMNLLVISVQTNELTMPEYIEKVKASIIDCKKLALLFKKAGKLDEAKKALRRSKIMENEVKEVEEAINSGLLDM